MLYIYRGGRERERKRYRYRCKIEQQERNVVWTQPPFCPPINMFPICYLIAAVDQQVVFSVWCDCVIPRGVLNLAVRIHLHSIAAADTRNAFTFHCKAHHLLHFLSSFTKGDCCKSITLHKENIPIFSCHLKIGMLTLTCLLKLPCHHWQFYNPAEVCHLDK